ncbi:hypothetical protein QUF72_22035 [Desulfobacterales bacterium HSG2]|nr:hypothetical protein [Desulfobacterales bacterium HSG2]
MIAEPNIKHANKFNEQYFDVAYKTSTQGIQKCVGVSEEFCDEFNKVAQATNLEIKNGKKPKFIKIA